MGLLQWVSGQGKKKQAAQTEFQSAVNEMFPNEGYTNAAIRMQNNLDAGSLPPSQYRWNKDVLPWRMSPEHWTDMMSTQEGLNPTAVNQLHSDYWKMNHLPDIMNNIKNIDILIKASENDNRMRKVTRRLIDEGKSIADIQNTKIY